MLTDEGYDRLQEAAVAHAEAKGTEAAKSVLDTDVRNIMESLSDYAFDPPSPLSGEWADDPSEQDVLRDVCPDDMWDDVKSDYNADPSSFDDLFTDYIDAYQSAYVGEIERRAAALP